MILKSIPPSLINLKSLGSDFGNYAPPAAEVQITVTGAFSPTVILKSGSEATVSWIEPDNTTTTGTTPSIADDGTRVIRMLCSNMDDIETFNVGFDHLQDGGDYNLGDTFDKDPEPVTAISGVNAMTGLKNFLAACPTLAGTLNFSGMSDLEYIECYQTNVTAVTLTGCSSLIRLCLEQTELTTLDLNPVAATLRDLRAANQRGGAGLTLTTLTSNMASLYHFCVRDQTLVGHPPMTRFPVLEQLWNWNTGQTGALGSLPSTIEELRSYDNAYTSVDVSGLSALSYIDLGGNSLDVDDVNEILTDLDALATSGSRSVLLSGLGAPTGGGDTARTNLIGRGWTVTTDAGAGWSFEDLFGTDRANLAAMAADGYASPEGASCSVTGGQLVRSSSGAYQQILNSGGGSAPADYWVEVEIPHTEREYYNFVTIRWDGSDGVRVGFEGDVDYANIAIGSATGPGSGNVTVVTDNGSALPSSWSVDQPHTMRVSAVGSTISLYLDGTLVCHGTCTINQADTGTSFGVGGGGFTNVYNSLKAGV